MFNGGTSTAGHPKFSKHDLRENFNDTFRVNNGILEVRYDKWTRFDGEFGHMFYKDPFLLPDCRGVRFVGEQVAGEAKDGAMRNNGLMLLGPIRKRC